MKKISFLCGAIDGDSFMRMLITTEADRQEFIRMVQALDLKHKFFAEVKIWRKKRSLPQNKLYWAWLRCIAKDGETGYTEEELHEYFKKRFLNWREKEIFGDSISIVKSSTELNTKEFTDYLDKIHVLMAGIGIRLPLPGDYDLDDFYAKYAR